MGKKKSAFLVVQSLPNDVYFDFVSAGTNYRITKADLITSLEAQNTALNVPDDSVFTFKFEGVRYLITKQNLLASLGIVDQPNTASRLISGSVTWISGLTFEVSACEYVIEGVFYTSEPATITLNAADGTNPRIDVIFVNTIGLADKLTGTAAADPAKPEVDPLTQLELTFVAVAAGATDPEGVSVQTLYAEDAGDPTEWNATAGAGTINLADTSDPYAGTKAIKFTDAFAGQTAKLTAGAGNELTVGELDSLELHVKAVAAWQGSQRLRVAFYNGPTRITSWVDIKDGNYGFDASNTTDYQTIGIPNADFEFQEGVADALWIQMNGNPGGSFNALVDQVRVQKGVTIVNNFIGLTEDQLVNNVRYFNVQQPFGNDDLIDGATVAWDLDLRPIATLTLGGNRTLTPISGIRAGGTYYLRVIQDGTGDHTLAYAAGVIWPGGTAPTITPAAGSIDVLTFVAFEDDGDLYGVAVQNFS